MDFDGTLAFEEAHDVGHRMFGWNFENEMDVIWAGVAFENVDFDLFGKFSENLSNLDSYWTVQHLLPVFWYNDHVVFAVPHGVTLCCE